MAPKNVDGVRRSSFRRSLASLRESVATELWPAPALAVVAAVVLGVVLPLLDRAVDARMPAALNAYLFAGGVDSARAVLSAISGSLITATSLTFSLTVVALQLASSQASPRVLRTFAKDRAVQFTLAIFVGTFAYALTVLRTVQDATDSADPIVPRIAVTLASLLTLASVFALTFFLGHLARQLRVETVLQQVHRETSRTIDLVRTTTAEGSRSVPDDIWPTTTHLALARSSGFVRGVDRARLLGIATENDLVIEEGYAAGHHAVESTPIARWWPRDALIHPEQEDIDARGREIAACFSLAYERTASQDIGFGIRQLTDIAVRALSPGVNDPTTAVHALGHVSAVLGDLAELPEQAAALEDENAAIRVILRRHDFAELVRTALEQPRRYGIEDPDVVDRMFQLLREVGFRARRPDDRDVVRDELVRLDSALQDASYSATERGRFAARSDQCRDALEGTWS